MITIILSILLAISLIITSLVILRLVIINNALNKTVQRLDFIINNETNINIDLECNNRYLKKLVENLNSNIKELNALKQHYRKKDVELKEAISNISHDLKTPLTVISSYAGLLEKETKFSKKSKTYLLIIKERTETMGLLIDELFTYSLYEARQFSLELKTVCLNDILEQSLTEFYKIFKQHKIEPEIKICDDKVYRNSNILALSRIFNNIISNALKYSEGDFKVVLKASGEIVFSNTALKLDEVTAGKLFERYFTVTSAKFSSGLGLSIARVLTERLNGKIEGSLKENILNINLKF